MRFSQDTLSLVSAAGETLEAHDWPGELLPRGLSRFSTAIRGNVDGQPRVDPALERQLAVVACVETMRLAARTGQRETPRKFYEVEGWPFAG